MDDGTGRYAVEVLLVEDDQGDVVMTGAARRALPDGSVSSGGGGTTLAGMTMAGRSSELA